MNSNMRGIEVRTSRGSTFFFCYLCQESLNDERELGHHLTECSHLKKLGNANLNLQKRNPWPFNDGVFFFHDAHLKLKSLQPLDGSFPSELNLHQSEANADCSGIPSSSALNVAASGRILDNPGVLLKGKASFIGIGKIGARYCEKDGVSNKLLSIWCEWVGKNNEDLKRIPLHDFAVVTLSYKSSMDRHGLADRIISCIEEAQLSDEGDSSGGESQLSDEGGESQLSDEGDSSGEESPISIVKEMVHMLFNDMCNICHEKMNPNTDVASLYDRTMGKFVCNIRNDSTEGDHVYHVSCLLRWILIFEVKAFEEHKDYPVFCPSCVLFGTPTPKREEIFCLDSKIKDGHEKWKASATPELENSPNSSIGLCFAEEKEAEGRSQVSTVKWLRFYRYHTTL